MNFKEKWENYWYHYKTHTIVGAILLVCVVYGLAQCVADVKPDLAIGYIGYSYVDPIMFEENSEGLAKAAGDVNGDGKELVILDPMVLGNSIDPKQDEFMLQKVGLSFAVGEDRIYILVPEVLDDPYYAEVFMPLDDVLKEEALKDGIKFQDKVIAVPCPKNEILEKAGIEAEGLYIAVRDITVADREIKGIEKIHSAALNCFRYIMGEAVK